MTQETGYTASLKISHLPDPFAIALQKGYSRDPLGWDIGLAHQAALAVGDTSIDDAHVARYGVPWSKWGKHGGAEAEFTHWPEALMILGRAGKWGVQFTPTNSLGYGVPLRECHDATHFGPITLIKEAFALNNKQGWTVTNPSVVRDASKPRGPFTQIEPIFGGSTIYYFNDVPETKPQPPTTVPPTPGSPELERELERLRAGLKAIRAESARAYASLPVSAGGAPAKALRKLISTIDSVSI